MTGCNSLRKRAMVVFEECVVSLEATGKPWRKYCICQMRIKLDVTEASASALYNLCKKKITK